jgi:hypothetical protein
MTSPGKCHFDTTEPCDGLLKGVVALEGSPNGCNKGFKNKDSVVNLKKEQTKYDNDSNKVDDVAEISNTWDLSVLSALCRWRSCTSEGFNKPPFLCNYHCELKEYLDCQCSTKRANSDSYKYLPRNIPMETEIYCTMLSAFNSNSIRDLKMIRAASTLLQELWDGKH